MLTMNPAEKAPPGDTVTGRQVALASKLLADLLNRATTLDALHFAMINVTDAWGAADHAAAHERFTRAVSVFLDDARETGILARRALLLAGGWPPVGFSAGSVDTEDQLAEIGGPFPWAEESE